MKLVQNNVHGPCWASSERQTYIRKGLPEPEPISPGDSGRNIGRIIGGSIEAEIEMGHETRELRPVRSWSDQDACCKKEPARAGDGQLINVHIRGLFLKLVHLVNPSLLSRETRGTFLRNPLLRTITPLSIISSPVKS